MKPEAVEFLFDCYLKEKQIYTSCDGDVVDGISWTGKQIEGEFDFSIIAESSLLYEEHHAPLLPHEEEVARNLGRQLSNMSDEFSNVRLSEQRGSTLNSNIGCQFEKRCMFASPINEKVEIEITCDENVDMERSVQWRTKNKTALAGIHYRQDGGEILFKIGEVKKIIEVTLLKSDPNRNLNFIVELLNSNSIIIGPINPITVYIIDYDNLDPNEKSVVKNILDSQQFSPFDVMNHLKSKITLDTFKFAIMFMCCNARSLHHEFTFAFELLRLTLPFVNRNSLSKVICDFFQQAPELEELQDHMQHAEK